MLFMFPVKIINRCVTKRGGRRLLHETSQLAVTSLVLARSVSFQSDGQGHHPHHQQEPNIHIYYKLVEKLSVT